MKYAKIFFTEGSKIIKIFNKQQVFNKLAWQSYDQFIFVLTVGEKLATNQLLNSLQSLTLLKLNRQTVLVFCAVNLFISNP